MYHPPAVFSNVSLQSLALFRRSMALLAEPMVGHALPAPLRLAHPAPVEAARGPGAGHVHAAARSLRGRPALGARLRRQPDGHRRRRVGSQGGGALVRPSGGQGGGRHGEGSGGVRGRCRRRRVTLSDVEALWILSFIINTNGMN